VIITGLIKNWRRFKQDLFFSQKISKSFDGLITVKKVVAYSWGKSEVDVEISYMSHVLIQSGQCGGKCGKVSRIFSRAIVSMKVGQDTLFR